MDSSSSDKAMQSQSIQIFNSDNYEPDHHSDRYQADSARSRLPIATKLDRLIGLQSRARHQHHRATARDSGTGWCGKEDSCCWDEG